MSNFTIDTDTAPATAKRGPGRPRGSTNKPRTTGATDAATLKQALSSLDSLYEFTTLGLTMFGFADTAMEWIGAAENLKKTNEDALRAAPKLANAIANAGSVGGAATFFIAHAIAFGGLARSIQGELRARATAKSEDAEPVDMIPFPGA